MNAFSDASNPTTPSPGAPGANAAAIAAASASFNPRRRTSARPPTARRISSARRARRFRARIASSSATASREHLALFANDTSPSAPPCRSTADATSDAPASPISLERRLSVSRRGHAFGAASAEASALAPASSTPHPPRLSRRSEHALERNADANAAHPPPSATGSSARCAVACAATRVSTRWTPTRGLSTRFNSSSAHRGSRRKDARKDAPSPHTSAELKFNVVVGYEERETRGGEGRGGEGRGASSVPVPSVPSPPTPSVTPSVPTPSARNARSASHTDRTASASRRRHPLRLTRSTPFVATRRRTSSAASDASNADAYPFHRFFERGGFVGAEDSSRRGFVGAADSSRRGFACSSLVPSPTSPDVRFGLFVCAATAAATVRNGTSRIAAMAASAATNRSYATRLVFGTRASAKTTAATVRERRSSTRPEVRATRRKRALVISSGCFSVHWRRNASRTEAPRLPGA